MTQLLVSVRNGEEASVAIQGGADILDVKEPNHGSLGMASLAAMSAAIEVAHQRGVASSIALGELIEQPDRPTIQIPPRVSFAKVGLANVCTESTDLDWRDRLRQFWQRAELHGTRPVAVAYADWRTAGASEISSVIDFADDLGCAAVLIDTFDKSRGGLLDHLSIEDVQTFVQSVYARGMKSALAGSLRPAQFTRLQSLSPDIIAVRGAVCSRGRTGRLELDLVRRCRDLLQEAAI